MRRVFEKIMTNSGFNLTGRIAIIVINILLVPFIVGKIGLKEYGIWVMVYAFTGYFNLLDFGISSAYVRFIAEKKAQDDKKGINEIISCGLFMNLVAVLIFFVIGILFRDFYLLKVLKVGGVSNISNIYMIAIIIFGMNFLFGIFQAVIDGFQRMSITNSILVVAKLVEAVLVIILLSNGLGPDWYCSFRFGGKAGLFDYKYVES